MLYCLSEEIMTLKPSYIDKLMFYDPSMDIFTLKYNSKSIKKFKSLLITKYS